MKTLFTPLGKNVLYYIVLNIQLTLEKLWEFKFCSVTIHERNVSASMFRYKNFIHHSFISVVILQCKRSSFDFYVALRQIRERILAIFWWQRKKTRKKTKEINSDFRFSAKILTKKLNEILQMRYMLRGHRCDVFSHINTYRSTKKTKNCSFVVKLSNSKRLSEQRYSSYPILPCYPFRNPLYKAG